MASGQTSVTSNVEQYRAEAYEAVGDSSRAENGQFFIPPLIAQVMAGLCNDGRFHLVPVFL